MNHGHWYVTVRRGGESAEFAFPAAVCRGSIEATEWAARLAPGWTAASVTWRASFNHRDLADNSQPDYGNPSAPFRSRPPWAA